MGKNMRPHRYFSYAKVFLFIQLHIKFKNMCSSKKLFNDWKQLRFQSCVEFISVLCVGGGDLNTNLGSILIQNPPNKQIHQKRSALSCNYLNVMGFIREIG